MALGHEAVGLTVAHGRWQYAVIQLARKAKRHGLQHGRFQTAWLPSRADLPPIQAKHAAFRVRAVHRNTFLNAPKLLDATFQLRADPGLYFTGQISGTEGYVESAAGGLLTAYFVAARLRGEEPAMPPPTTALGGIVTHLGRNAADYQP